MVTFTFSLSLCVLPTNYKLLIFKHFLAKSVRHACYVIANASLQALR
jgi:hypothetical protein